MIWVQHDFYENFTTSVDSNDIELSLDIFRSEISDLLTYKSESICQLFDKLNIKYSKKASYQDFLDIIIREIKVNDKFVRGLSFLIGESNDVVKKKKNVKWEKLLNQITKGIKKIATFFMDNPSKENRFKRQVLGMIELKSSILGDDNRPIRKKDNTLAWIIGIALLGTAAYLIWRYFDKQNQEKMRLESLNPNVLASGGGIDSPIEANTPAPAPPAPPIDPSYSVPNDVLIPETPPATTPTTGAVQINVQPLPQPNTNANV